MKGELIIEVNGEKKVHKDLMLDNYKHFIYKRLLGNTSFNKEPDIESDNPYYVNNKRILIGTGTTSPTRSDGSLANQVASTTSVSTTVGSDFISFAASITVGSAYDITEAGLGHHILNYYYLHNPRFTWKLLTRDTFSAVPLTANDTISITVTLNM